MSKAPRWRRGVGIMLLDRERASSSAAASTAPDAWQMPQGGIDKGEEPRQAALRELKEETGVTAAEIIAEAREWLRYELPPELQRHGCGAASIAARSRSGSRCASPGARPRSTLPPTIPIRCVEMGAGGRAAGARRPLQARAL